MTIAPHVGLSLMLEDDYRLAALPLFEEGRVEVLEWSFDIGWGPNGTPDWANELIDFYSSQRRLIGHGVTFSPLSGAWHHRQSKWLERLARECATRRYEHISEHFGFMTAGSFHQSAPLPVPLRNDILQIGQSRLRQLSELARCPVGLENLAFAFGPRDVQDQGHFLDQLLSPVDGFLLLDLHNIYCQSCNFGIPGEHLIERYPLHRVRELHVSGGSWSESQAEPERGLVRRDTHDDRVPEEVFRLVPVALARCPGVEAVIMERLGGTIDQEEQASAFREDFIRLQEIVAAYGTGTQTNRRPEHAACSE